jgi:manganese transport protein
MALDGSRKGPRALLPFVGPALIASVGYMDPGNFATNIQVGSDTATSCCGSCCLPTCLVAMLFHGMSANLGTVTGRNLAMPLASGPALTRVLHRTSMR